MPKPTMAELRNAAIDKRNAVHAEIEAEYAREAQAEDTRFDAEFDRARDHYERIRARPRPEHALPQEVRDRKLAEADRKLDDELKTLYLAHSIDDNRYN
jgi:hypothetical protein